MKVCVIGAGIVGCATAYHLARSGFSVQLVDAGSKPGTGTSFANGAQLSYSYVEPFASPGTFRSIPSLLLSPDSPIRFRLRADPKQWAWIAQFLAACTTKRVEAGTRRLLALAGTSRSVLDRWLHEEKWEVGFKQNGKLVLCPTDAVLKKQEVQVKLQAKLGSTQQILSRDDCVAHEPALHHAAGDFVGGVWTPDECVADPYLLCKEMARALVRLGGQLSMDTKVLSFKVEAGKAVAARTNYGNISADIFVIASGLDSAKLSRQLGVRLPVYPLKGYSITVPFVAPAELRPVASVTDLGRKTVFAPLGDKLRVAAMVEIGARDTRIPPARISAMVDSVRTIYPAICDVSQPTEWAGLRPATPDSLPIIGQLRTSNVFLNAGHGALGLTLAAGSAHELGEEIDRYVMRLHQRVATTSPPREAVSPRG